MSNFSKRTLALALLATVAFAVGCGSDGALTGDAVPNNPPETNVSSTPPVLSQTSFTVTFYWNGSDRDGDVVGYEWRISSNGVDGMVDVADTLEANLPWHFTEVTDSTFVVSAELDSFPPDIDISDDPADYRFWQTHTFFIRSIDDEGKADPTPANVSFTATTLAPSVTIDVPVYIPFNSCVSAARVLTFGWTGDDPDNPEGEPAEVRYMLIQVGGPNDACLTTNVYTQRAGELIRSDDPRWSDWIAYDAPQDSGRAVTLPRQEVGNSYLFVVQGRDVAGAVSPTFTWGENVRHVRIGTDKFPLLTVSEKFLGTDTFVSTNGLKSFEIVSGQPLEFEWGADASSYAGIIEAFRYGWNLSDPDDPNDPGWSVAWGNGPNWRRALPRSFTQGSPSFVVQSRDNSGTISRAFYQFQVIQIADPQNQREVLLIDDWRSQGTPEAQALEIEWDRKWEDILLSVRGFQRTDVVDAQDETERVSFATVNRYRTAVWFTNASDQSFFHTRLAPQSPTAPRYNWLEVYQARVGNLFFVGPGAMYNSLERNPPPWLFPIIFNVRQGGDLGFGTIRRPDGSIINAGTTRWPYSGWCLESVDIVRPAFTKVFNEPAGRPLRLDDCAGLQRARVSDDLGAAFPSSDGEVFDLVPAPVRTNKDPQYQLRFEEFYNTNVTAREVTLNIRDCQVPMFEHIARRDVDNPAWVDPPDPTLVPNDMLACPPFNRTESPLSGAPIGIVSRVYEDTKQSRGSQDFLWGFHPFGFQSAGVRAAILWIFSDRWGLDVN